MAASSFVFVGIRGRVIALDRATGAEIWAIPLKVRIRHGRCRRGRNLCRDQGRTVLPRSCDRAHPLAQPAERVTAGVSSP